MGTTINGEAYVTQHEAADMLGLSYASLKTMRTVGTVRLEGVYPFGSAMAFRAADVQAEARRRNLSKRGALR